MVVMLIAIAIATTKMQLKQQGECFDCLLIAVVIAIAITAASQDKQADSRWNARDNYSRHSIIAATAIAKASKHIDIIMLTTAKVLASIVINSMG